MKKHSTLKRTSALALAAVLGAASLPAVADQMADIKA